MLYNFTKIFTFASKFLKKEEINIPTITPRKSNINKNNEDKTKSAKNEL